MKQCKTFDIIAASSNASLPLDNFTKEDEGYDSTQDLDNAQWFAECEEHITPT